uniref:Pectinesterase inhibitor domain-containing protein n=1 Tax=Aegilops tauschii TaxID=37682 RepID=N1R0Z8_AEGTA
MAPLRALSSVLLLLLVQHARTARASTLEDTCRLVGTGGAQDYDFCVKTLGADPASATADVATADELGLAVIALRIGQGDRQGHRRPHRPAAGRRDVAPVAPGAGRVRQGLRLDREPAGARRQGLRHGRGRGQADGGDRLAGGSWHAGAL